MARRPSAESIPSHDPDDSIPLVERDHRMPHGELISARGDEAFDRLTRLAAQVTEADAAVVSLVQPVGHGLLGANVLAERLEAVVQAGGSQPLSKDVVVNDAPVVTPGVGELQGVMSHSAGTVQGVEAFAGYPLHDPDGEVLGALSVSSSAPRVWTDEQLGMLRDLVAATETEIALRLRTNEAQLRQERIQHVINGFVHTAVLAADADGVVTKMNNAAVKFLGLDAATVVGTRTLASILHACHPVGPDSGAEQAQDWLMVDGAGSSRVVTVWSSIFRDASGHVAGYTFVGDDVSTRREAEALLQETARQQDQVVQQLTELDEARHIFLTNASHELRTPISSILGYTELLADGVAGGLSPEQLDLLTRVEGNARRLSALAEDLFDLSRSKPIAPPTGGGIDANVLAQQAWESIQSDVAGRGLAAHLSLCDGAPRIVEGSPVERALIELLRNAVKFSLDGGIVRLIVRASASGVEFEVSDTGIGIAESAQNFVFDPFFRTEQAQTLAIPGAGIGLSIVRRIVEAFQGEVRLTSRTGTGTGTGTTVVVALPIPAQVVEPRVHGGVEPAELSRAVASPDLDLGEDLRRALEGTVDQFVLHYQPVMDLTSGRVVGVESLVRWQHPALGLLGADQFIPLAENTGLVHRLGDWILEQAARDSALMVHEGRDLDVAVNFSAQQLDGRAVGKIRRACASHGLEPGRLILEVTESAFVENDEVTTAVYEAMTRLGARIAIDDFGTGFSSLLHLRRYPIDALKIDGEFVAGIGERADDEAICASIISLAGAVGASTVAEGVETAEQYAVLRSLGCLRGQGFLWSAAVPIGELDAAFAACKAVAVAPRRSRMSRAVDQLPSEATTIIIGMHTEGASPHTIAAALNRTVGRHPSGVRWTAGAVSRAREAEAGRAAVPAGKWGAP